MVVELFLAALAFYVWLAVEPGFVRALAFNVMLVAGVSTLIFNGNPLLRYDAYYILADLIEMPNLAQQAARHWGYLAQRYVLRSDSATPVAHSTVGGGLAHRLRRRLDVLPHVRHDRDRAVHRHALLLHRRGAGAVGGGDDGGGAADQGAVGA